MDKLSQLKADKAPILATSTPEEQIYEHQSTIETLWRKVSDNLFNIKDVLSKLNQLKTDLTEKLFTRRLGANVFTSETATIGDSSNNVVIDNTGIHLNGTAIVYDEVQFPFITAKLLGTSDPALSKICDNGSGSTGIYAYSFSNTKLNEIWVSQEMPHWYKEGSSPTMHLHLYPSTNLGGVVLIDVEYAFNNIGAVLGNSTVVQVPLTIPTNSAKKHLYYELLTVNGTSLKISHGIGIRVARRGDLAGDTHEGAIWITRAALHVEKDSLGSKTVTSK